MHVACLALARLSCFTSDIAINDAMLRLLPPLVNKDVPRLRKVAHHTLQIFLCRVDRLQKFQRLQLRTRVPAGSKKLPG